MMHVISPNLIFRVNDFPTLAQRHEGADGRYREALRDLPLTMDANQDSETGPFDTLKVEVAVRVPVGLPSPGMDFGGIIETLRGKESVKQLRTAMDNLVCDTDFHAAENAWNWVSDDLATLITSRSKKQINVWMLILKAGRSAILGALADLLLRATAEDVPTRLLAPAAGALLNVGGGLSMKVARADLERQRITPMLEDAIEFSCVPN
jgi:hypothetical protein